MSPERQRQVLMALVGALVVIGAWRYLGAATADTPAAATAARRLAAAVAPVSARRRAARGARGRPHRPGRDRAQSVRVRGPSRPRRPSGRAPPARRRRPPITPPPPSGPPPLPPIPFKFIGLVEDASGARRLAVLSDSKGLVVHGAQGAIIDGRFRILSIGPDSIEIAYADGRGRQTLRLTGQ